MALHLHRERSTRQLAEGLAGLLSAPLPDPFAQDVVVVPARGVERWLAQTLSHRLGVGPRGGDGVCAGIRFLNPHALGSLLLGIEDQDPWHPDRLAWRVLSVLDASLGEAWCRPVAVHLGADREGVEATLRRNRRFSLARRVAGLFSSYAAQRSQLLTDWRQGGPPGGEQEGYGDGAGGRLPDDLAWQAELWRRVVAASPEPPPDVRHLDTLARLRAGGDGLDLPDRLSLFGHTRMTRADVELIQALAEHRDVHLWLPHPSPGLWQRLAGPTAAGPVRRRSDDTAGFAAASGSPTDRAGHPLLASLGRDLRELQRTLAGVPGRDDADAADAVDAADAPATGGPATLLGWLQDDLAADTAPDAALRGSRVLTGAGAGAGARVDDSVQVHACHGLERQVGVLREVLTGLLADDETLEPRDVLVMTPDVEAVAPLIQGAFGLGSMGARSGLDGDGGTHPAHELRVRLADRGLANTNPLLALAVTLVELAAGRATASEILDLASRPVVRARFGFTDSDLDRLQRWVAEAAIRWGLTPELRAPFGLGGLADNTWQRGLSRLLLGVAMADEEFRTLGGTVPVDDVGSGAIDLVGRFVEFVDRLQAAVVALDSAGDLAHWVRTLGDAVRAIGAVGRREAWQVSQFERELATLLAEGTPAEGSAGPPAGADLRLPDIRALLERRVAARPTRANFRTGALTVCTMVPMRSVPHRVVVLLGVDDTVFPRSHGVDGDDVLARDPMTGERDPHSEDRQLFLDAIMAAGDKLVITYSGFSEHTGDARPPTVPLGELLDALEQTAVTADGGRVGDAVRREHPLQPFDERNFDAERPFSFHRAACAGAVQARRQRPAPEFLTAPLPAVVEDSVSVADLKAFFVNPAAAFLRRLDVTQPERYDEVRDAIPIDLGGLERWSVGDRLLRAAFAGGDAGAIIAAEQRRGHLPPGELGESALHDVLTVAQPLLEETARVRVNDPESVDIDVDLEVDGASSVRLGGTVGDLFGGCHLVRVGYSAVGSRQLLDAWLDLLALTASRPEETFVAHCLGKSPTSWAKSPIAHVKLGPVLPERAREELATLVRLRARGLRSPLRLPRETGRVWATAHKQGKSAAQILHAAEDKWVGRESPPMPGESADASWVRILGAKCPFGALTHGDELGSLADAVWLPLLDAQVVLK